MIYFLYGIFLLLLCVAVAVGVVGGTISGLIEGRRRRKNLERIAAVEKAKRERTLAIIAEIKDTARKVNISQIALEHPEDFKTFEEWISVVLVETKPSDLSPEQEASYRRHWLKAQKQ